MSKSNPKSSKVTKSSSPVSKVTPVSATRVEAAPAKASPVVVAPEPTVVSSAVSTVVSPVRDRTAVISLIAKLNDLDAEVARDAALTLAGLPMDLEAVHALSTVVRNSEGFFHPVVRAAAASALGKLSASSSVDALLIATRDSMAEASQEAVIALGLIGDRRALSALKDIVANADGYFLEHVQKSAQEAIIRIESKIKA